ncbi:hypothetical protein PGQ11_005739 [Apiospora arundinis]|uniref:Clr5 domain-containing protein n=1 Tax=Apiospora arundinis TaxID=335852 RepID=A0ABR2JBN1_9PEZI
MTTTPYGRPILQPPSPTARPVTTASQEYSDGSRRAHNPQLPTSSIFQDNALGTFLDLNDTPSSQSYTFNIENHQANAIHPYSGIPRSSMPHDATSVSTAIGQYSIQSNPQPQQPYDGMRSILNPLMTNHTVLESSPVRSDAAQISGRSTQAPRAPRLRRPPEALWDKHKPILRTLYIEQNLPLKEVMDEMSKTYSFNASKKMYKDSFKTWNWTKHVPKEKLSWMMNKVTKCKPRKIAFRYGNMDLSEERIKKLSDPQNQTDTDEHLISGPTPSDVEYRTALSIGGRTPQESHDLHPLDEEDTSHDASSKFNYDGRPEGCNLRFLTMENLRTLQESACEAVVAGDHNTAETKFRDSLLGFRHLLSPTHDETLRAGYKLATFYANVGQMGDADAVLDWMTSKHVDVWGGRHTNTLVHHARLIKLLHQWGRTEQAEIILFKLMHDTNDLNDITDGIMLGELIHGGGSIHQVANQENLVPFPHEFQGPATITHQLKLLEWAPSVSGDTFANFLPHIIDQCEARPEELGPQELQARCILAKIHFRQVDYEGCASNLSVARQKASHLLCPSQDLPSRALLKAASQLAFTLLEVNNHRDSNAVLEDILGVLQSRPQNSDEEEDREVLLDFLWSTAAELNRQSGWSRVGPWVERCFGICIKTEGLKSKDTRAFEKMLIHGKFEYHSERKVDDIMDSSTGLFRIRLV